MSVRISATRSGVSLLVTSLLVASLIVGAASPALATASAPLVACRWAVVPNDEPVGRTGALEGVVALSADDAWAVGSVQARTRALPLAEHWDGSAWHVVPTPVDLRHVRILHDVAALAPDDVWAVGTEIVVSTGAVHPLVEHWDGAAWARVRPPHSGSDHAELLAVSAGSPTKVWVAGYREPGFSPDPFVARWRGTRWHVVAAPPGDTLMDVSSRRSGAVWTVGTNPFSVNHALLEHRGGAGWQSSDAPPRALTAISWRRQFDAWAVGYQPGTPPAFLQPLAMHWDGQGWTVSPTPELKRSSELRGVAATSPKSAWAVGTRNFKHPLLLHWNGAIWKVAFGPYVNGFLNDVGRVPATDTLWAVGSSSPHPLIMRYC
jgi:hypothetical protein